MDLNVCIVLPASGIGERMGSTTPKQFCHVMGRPLISHTMEAFERISWVKKVVVAVLDDKRRYMDGVLEQYHSDKSKFVVITGGSTRHRTIFNGVKVIRKVHPSCEVVVIHDGVRPFVDEETLQSVTHSAWEHGASGAVRPLVSTVITTDGDGFLERSLDRSKHRASEMPQAFRLDVITQAYEKSTDYDLDYGTECLHLAQNYAGVNVKLVEGPNHLWKVTHKKDLYATEGVMKDLRSDTCLFAVGGGDDKEDRDLPFDIITSRFSERDIKVSLGDSNTKCVKNSVVFLCEEDDRLGLDSVQHSGDVFVFVLNLLCGTRESDVERLVGALRNEIRHWRTSMRRKPQLAYGIVFQGEGGMDKAAAIACNLIYNQDAVFDGQVFLA